MGQDSETNKVPQGADSPQLPCSAFMLVKRGPNGRDTTHKFDSEMEMAKHLIAMWKYTTGYSVVAIFRLPNTSVSNDANRR